MVTHGLALSLVAIRVPRPRPTALSAIGLPLAIALAQIDSKHHRVSGGNVTGLDVVSGFAASRAGHRSSMCQVEGLSVTLSPTPVAATANRNSWSGTDQHYRHEHLDPGVALTPIAG